MTEYCQSKTLINEIEAARILGLCPTTLRRWRWAGTGPSFLKMGGAVRYDLAVLDAYIEACRRRSTSDLGTVNVKNAA